jgi:hypothetical protein
MSAEMGYCGLARETCPIYLATRVEDKDVQARMRTEIAAFCAEHYGVEYGPDDINDCDGCQAETERLLSGCKDCGIRNCAKEKGLATCAACSDYACDKLQAFFAKEPDGKRRLDEMRKSIL